MERIDFDSEIRELSDIGMYNIPQRVGIRIPNSRELLKKGLSYFLDNPKWVAEYDDISSWLEDNQGRGLFVNGSCGLGKTLICAKIIPLLINHYHRKIVTISDAQKINDRIDELKTRKLLMIDDVGTEGESVSYGNRRQAFSEIVDSAEKNGNLLIITTNLSGEELIAKYGIRTADRLKSITKHVKISGKSMRK